VRKDVKQLVEETRKRAEDDLLFFIRLIAPHRVLGDIHKELVAWWNREDAKDNQLLLLPRDHQKSAMIAYRVAWWITKFPDTTVLYVSATADLAEKQLKFIKDIMTSDIYRAYWPEMLTKNENDRERWTVDEIAVSHPKRKQEGVRDPTVKAVGLTANTTGLHCNVAVLDDIVVPTNAYTEMGRTQTKAFYSQLSSIETTGAKEWAVGTRYHPADIYKDMIDMKEYFYDEETDEDIEQDVYEVFERVVETNGEFLWPKQRRADGKSFGFNERELARKKAKYLDVTQFYSQYYNNPNNSENSVIDSQRFQYYDRTKLNNMNDVWYVDDSFLNVYAAIDFAFTTNDTSDYTAIVVVGVDKQGRIFVLDIDRFKTNKISVMFEHVQRLYVKWRFRKLRAEITVAQAMIVEQFKEFMRKEGNYFSIDEHRPSKHEGTKEERILTNLEPRYASQAIWHYKGGNCQVLEEELLLAHPEHDDVKDALSAVTEILVVPYKKGNKKIENVVYSSRFGGVAFNGAT
jgi:phage terminase large subunit-like protein